MKINHLIYTLPLAALFSSNLIGAPLFHDSFSGTTGVTPTGWTTVGSAGTHNDFVTSGSLAIDGLADSTGGKWSLNNSTNNGYRTNFSSSVMADNTTVYYSFILQVDDISGLSTTPTNGLIGLSSSALTTVTGGAVGTVGISKDPNDGTKFNLTFDGDFRGAGTPSTVGAILPTQFSTGESIFIVVAYHLGTNNATSSADIWVNPDSSSFSNVSPPSVTASDSAAYRNNIQSIIVSSGTGASLTPNGWSLDEFRVGTSWADVTPTAVPEPSTYALMAGVITLGLASLCRRRKQLQ